MPKTIAVSLSEAAIKRHAAQGEVAQLRDPQHPIRFRYRKNRERGSFYVISRAQGKEHWHKIGNYPGLTVKAALSALPEVMKRLAIEPKSSELATSGWTTVGEVLEWYAQRVAQDANLSKKQKSIGVLCSEVPSKAMSRCTAYLRAGPCITRHSTHVATAIQIQLGTCALGVRRAQSCIQTGQKPQSARDKSTGRNNVH